MPKEGSNTIHPEFHGSSSPTRQHSTNAHWSNLKEASSTPVKSYVFIKTCQDPNLGALVPQFDFKPRELLVAPQSQKWDHSSSNRLKADWSTL